MEYINAGGLKISRLTLGTVALGKQYGISNQAGQPSSTEAAAILTTALEAGINTLDTANDYGNAEQLIGNYIHARNKAVVVTKFKVGIDSLSDKQRVREEACKSIRSSLRLLQLEKIPVCLYHKEANAPTDRLMELLPDIFAEMKKEGLVDIAGVSVYHPDEIRVFGREDIFQAFQIPMNVFDQRLIHTGMLPELQQQNKIVFIRSVFLQGLFFMDKTSLKGNLTAAGKYLDGLQDIAKREGMSVAQLAFSYVRDTQGVSSLVFGAVNTDQVKENVRLFEGSALSEKTRSDIEMLASGIPEEIIIPGKWSF